MLGMLKRWVRASLLGAAIGGGFSALDGQTVPVVRVSRPSAVFDEPFSSVNGLRELSDGRVLITDGTEVSVRLLDFGSGAARQVGRTGSGPREYTRPTLLYPAAGDTTHLLDLGGRRLLTIAPDGRLLDRVIPLRMLRGAFKPPRGMDVEGRTYFDLADIRAPGLEQAAARGLAPILRWTPGTDRLDTIAEVRFPPMGGPAGGGIRPLAPYQPRDAWAVDQEGAVVVVLHDPYRVEWFLPRRSQPVVGPTVTYEPVRIGRAEREAWLDRLRQGAAVVVTQGGAGRTVRPSRPSADAFDWPAHQPPFEGAAWIGPGREVWIQRSRPATAPRPLYDVFDGAGRLVRQVELPPARRIIGFGIERLYAARVDDDGLQWLERYDLRELGGPVP